ncbi:uncharacterized protein LOC107701388 [Sinocyclocheilus anshuiensis]|uniref:uncharacterized protein LOC107701388 n=1 Tax=Sinocyclocheilus anshuiensis TaxID=1608454 RepID=UPI0007BAD27B|nr:PREDICTED: uncharacterized protein LOC107701388 [Sinocyclocheilus anshuiensis]
MKKRSRAPSEALSVQQHEGLQPLGDVPAVRQAVFDDGARRQTLQRGVVDGLDQVLGQLLLVQQVAGRLLEGVGAVEVRAAGDQQVHDVGVVVGRSHMQRAVVVLVAAVHVCAALQQDRSHLEGGELADGVAAHAGGVPVHRQVQRTEAVLPAGLQLQELVDGLFLEVVLLHGARHFLQQTDEVQDDGQHLRIITVWNSVSRVLFTMQIVSEQLYGIKWGNSVLE